jgi:hypothetical protein
VPVVTHGSGDPTMSRGAGGRIIPFRDGSYVSKTAGATFSVDLKRHPVVYADVTGKGESALVTVELRPSGSGTTFAFLIAYGTGAQLVGGVAPLDAGSTPHVTVRDRFIIVDYPIGTAKHYSWIGTVFAPVR